MMAVAASISPFSGAHMADQWGTCFWIGFMYLLTDSTCVYNMHFLCCI